MYQLDALSKIYMADDSEAALLSCQKNAVGTWF